MGLPQVVLDARERLRLGREKLRAQHDAGSRGIQVCAKLTDLSDSVVLDFYYAILEKLKDELPDGLTPEIVENLPSEMVLVANGGYGRRDVAPYSDVDLMLLYKKGAQDRVAPFARFLTQYICDAGLDLGFSLRTPREACTLARSDAQIFTSLAESRFLVGSASLLARFMKKFRRAAMRRSRKLIPLVRASRREERQKYGETVYLLKPNLKRSRGGLRDLQLLRWVAFACYGETDIDALYRMGKLSREDRNRLRNAHDFLLRLRNELHFENKKSHDMLDKDEQLRIAELWGYQGSEGVMPVEELMRDYFAHSSEVRHITAHFVAIATDRQEWGSFFKPLFSHQVEGDFRVGSQRIGATKRGLKKVSTDFEQVLRLMDLANLYDTKIDHRTWHAIRDWVAENPDVTVTKEVNSRFLSLLSQPARLGMLLRRLHELHVLEKIIPEMKPARCLLQFNEFHKYTVDEHTLRAVDRCTEFMREDSVLGDAYRSLHNKRVLHLALLVHDLGKGQIEDHSEVGRRIAIEVAKRFELPDREAGILKFLVHKHLLMSHTAMQLDINDDRVVVDFASQVRSPDVLKMLFTLTCADMAAVGPGTLNQWRLELLNDLYRRTMRHVADEEPATRSTSAGIETRRKELFEAAVSDDASQEEREWWERQVAAIPPRYMFAAPRAKIVAAVSRLQDIPHNEAVAWGEYLPDREVIEYTIGAHDAPGVGMFHRITGVLSSNGQSILWADICSLDDNLILDRFQVHDLDFEGEPPPHRLEEISALLVEGLVNPSADPPSFRRVWKQDDTAQHELLKTRVSIDNETSDELTILNIFAHDRIGLLYTISKTIFDLGLEIKVAKIGTFAHQVVDVFYVHENDGRKVFDPTRIEQVKTRLLAAIKPEEAEVA